MSPQINRQMLRVIEGQSPRLPAMSLTANPRGTCAPHHQPPCQLP